MAKTAATTTTSSSSSSTRRVDGTPVTKTTTTYVTSTPVTKTTVHRTVGGVTTTSTTESVGEAKTTASSYTTVEGGSSKALTAGVPSTTTTTYTSESHTLGSHRLAGGISQESALVLEKALQDEANYSKNVTVRIRVFEIRSVTKQVVSGTNYRYEVVGARESATNSTEVTSIHAAKAVYAITVYEQTWTNTLQVTGIELLNKDVNAPVDAPTKGYGAVSGSDAAGAAAAAPGTKKVTSFLASIDSWFS